MASSSTNVITAADLRFPDLFHHYNSLCSRPIHEGKLVHYEDFASFDLERSLPELKPLLGSSSQAAYYPELVRLFYTNLSTNHGQTTITTKVRGRMIFFNASSLGNILNLPSTGTDLTNIVPLDRPVLRNILLSTHFTQLPWHLSNLQPHAQLLAQILLHNIYPKLPRKGLVPRKISLLLYAIFCSTPINWSNIIFAHFIRYQKFQPLLFGCFITPILKHFKVPLQNEVILYPSQILNATSFNPRSLHTPEL